MACCSGVRLVIMSPSYQPPTTFSLSPSPASYSTLVMPVTCHACRTKHSRTIALRYGFAGDHKYQQGDKIHWGEPHATTGEREATVAIVSASALTQCPTCQAQGEHMAVMIKQGAIVAAEDRSSPIEMDEAFRRMAQGVKAPVGTPIIYQTNGSYWELI